MTEFSEIPSNEVVQTERIHTPDAELTARLAKVGVVLPGEEHFRGVINPQEGFSAVNIIGTPLYAYSDISEYQESNNEMRMHEMTHGFLQAHLVPKQPRIGILWENLTDTDVIALTKDHYDSNDYAAHLADEAKTKLTQENLNRYRSDPLRALLELQAVIGRQRLRDLRSRKADVVLGRQSPPPFEATMTSVTQRITSELRDQIYEPYGTNPDGKSRAKDMEEALATYFAYKALPGAPASDTWEFHQGDQAEAFTLALAKTYPDAKQVSGIIAIEGMKGFLEQNRHLF